MLKPVEIEIDYLNEKELKEISKDKTFISYVNDIFYKHIKEAIEQKEEVTHVFTITNLGFRVKIEKSQYKKFLTKVLKTFEKEEKYLECAEIIKLLK